MHDVICDDINTEHELRHGENKYKWQVTNLNRKRKEK